MSTTAEILLDLLAARGVDCVFGIPGNHTVELYRGFAARNIRVVTCRHEQGAAFMADGYARATGQPGVCVLISGPGLLNAATAIAQSLADSVPMLVISGVANVADLGMGRGTLHELPDQRASAASFCRSTHTLLEPRNLAPLLDQAFNSFHTSRPGPVHIEIPLDLMTAELAQESSSSSGLEPLIGAPGPDPSLIQAAFDRLRSAQQPLLLVGGGAVKAAGFIREFAEWIGAPVLNTVNGKGILPADHPLAVGGSPSLPCLRQALMEADLVLAIGTELGETDYDLLMAEPLTLGPTLIRLDIDARQCLTPQVPAIGITSDALLGVQALAALCSTEKCSTEKCSTEKSTPQDPGPVQNSHKRVQRSHESARRLRQQVRAEPHYHPEMQSFFDALLKAAPNAVIVGDSARPTYYASWQLECSAPRRYFHSVSGFGTLGYALPAAFGACLGTGQPAIALIGDGGIQFTLPELSTAAELSLPVAVIVWHNDGYREIENSMQAKQIGTDSTRLQAPDFEAAARAHHADYARPRTLDALQLAVEAATRATGPTLIEVREDDFLQSPSGRWYE